MNGCTQYSDAKENSFYILKVVLVRDLEFLQKPKMPHTLIVLLEYLPSKPISKVRNIFLRALLKRNLIICSMARLCAVA